MVTFIWYCDVIITINANIHLKNYASCCYCEAHDVNTVDYDIYGSQMNQ